MIEALGRAADNKAGQRRSAPGKRANQNGRSNERARPFMAGAAGGGGAPPEAVIFIIVLTPHPKGGTHLFIQSLSGRQQFDK